MVSNSSPSHASTSAQQSKNRRRGLIKLFLVISICAAPVIASYYIYYFVRPEGRVNYGDLIEPQRVMPQLTLRELDGNAVEIQSLKGKWLLVMAADGACDSACSDKLYHLRQVRMSTGKERERVERVWFIMDGEPLQTLTMREFDGTRMLRADPEQVSLWLPKSPDGTVRDHIYIVDPFGNLMMRFPKNADPSRMRRDLTKLLRASRIG